MYSLATSYIISIDDPMWRLTFAWERLQDVLNDCLLRETENPALVNKVEDIVPMECARRKLWK
jgi:hypothetical protein